MITVLESSRSRNAHHFDYSVTAKRYWCISSLTGRLAFSYRKVHVGSLTCAAVLVRAESMKARQAVARMHKC